MGRGRSAVRRDVLSGAVGRGGRHPTLLHHDRNIIDITRGSPGFRAKPTFQPTLGGRIRDDCASAHLPRADENGLRAGVSANCSTKHDKYQ